MRRNHLLQNHQSATPDVYKRQPQMLITSLDYSAYTGRIAVGRVHRGTLKEGMNITLAKRDGSLIDVYKRQPLSFPDSGAAWRPDIHRCSYATTKSYFH